MLELEKLRNNISIRSKKGLHFIITSIFIWLGVLITWLLPFENILTKNLLTFCFTAPLLPLSYIISKIIKSEFSISDNPLSKLGFLFACNQFLYILIAMWAYRAVPDKMVMILALIFGAHLLPFGWLYKSKAYLVMSIVISFVILVVGVMFDPVIVSVCMVIMEIIFSGWLISEVKKLQY